MNHTLLSVPPAVPLELSWLTDGAIVYDSSCSRAARVYFVDRSSCLQNRGQFYLKVSPLGTLAREATATRYFHARGLGAEVLFYGAHGFSDCLLTRCVPGEDATSALHLANPRRLSVILGETLRALHELPAADCPMGDTLADRLKRAEENYRAGTYDTTHFPDSFGYRSAEEAWDTFVQGRHLLRADTLTHGDYCLPNILFSDWHLTGFIDLGDSGLSDRHTDLFWGAWSLSFNLGTDNRRDTFFDAYGRDRIDEAALRVVAAAEVFG